MENSGARRGEDLANRLARYAGEVLRISAELPNTKEEEGVGGGARECARKWNNGRHVRDELMRSGTAPGAHYAEARGGQSAADFIHKVALAAKEARESLHWLRTSMHARFVEQDIGPLADEGEQLTAILTASLHTARNNRKRSKS